VCFFGGEAAEKTHILFCARYLTRNTIAVNLPIAFMERMKVALAGDYPAFEASLTQPAPVSLRLNPTKPVPGFPQPDAVPWHPQGRYLPERPVYTLDPLFHAGAYYVQEASSMFVYQAIRQWAEHPQKLRVLDLCAAPGGKSTLLASALGNEGLVVANEVIQSRVPALRMNLEKWGFPNVAIVNHDPADFSKLPGFFDVVLVDAPCSGEGLFRKSPEAAGEWSVSNAAHCEVRQKRILAEAVKLVKPGGLLIYATCTFNPKENGRNIPALLQKGAFEFCPLETEKSWGVEVQEYGYQFYPHRVRGEGFFMACLRKSEGERPPEKRKNARFAEWRNLPAKEKIILRPWLSDLDKFEIFEKANGGLVALDAGRMEDYLDLAAALKRRAFGIQIGKLKGRNFVPSHALALSQCVSASFPSVELSKEEALRLLRKEEMVPEKAPKGWCLARFEGLNLGWMKVLEHRINNYFPPEWRIRM